MKEAQPALFDLPPDLSPKFEPVHMRIGDTSQLVDAAMCIRNAVDNNLEWASWWPVSSTRNVADVTCSDCKELLAWSSST